MLAVQSLDSDRKLQRHIYIVIAGRALMSSVVLSFFFFQAEDGIRDYKVTGVQTCALPISLAGGNAPRRRISACQSRKNTLVGPPGPYIFVSLVWKGSEHRAGKSRGPNRSEERRVGKEGRSRWSPDH